MSFADGLGPLGPGLNGDAGSPGATGATGASGATGATGAAGGRFDFGAVTVAQDQTSATAWMIPSAYSNTGLQGSTRGFVALEDGEIYAGSECCGAAGSGAGTAFYEVFINGSATGKGLSVPLTTAAGTGTLATLPVTIPYSAGQHVAVKPYRVGSGGGRSNVTLSYATRAM